MEVEVGVEAEVGAKMGAEMGKRLCRCRRARLRAALCDSNEASFILFHTCARQTA